MDANDKDMPASEADNSPRKDTIISMGSFSSKAGNTNAPTLVAKADWLDMIRLGTRRQQGLVAFACLLAVASGLAAPTLMYLQMDLIDSLAAADTDKVGTTAIAAAITGAILFVDTLVYMSLLLHTGESIMNTTRQKLLSAILKQDIEWFERQKTGGLASQISADVELIADAIGEKLGLALNNFFTFVFCLALAFWKSWRLTLVILCFAPAIILAAAITALISGRLQKRIDEAYSSAGAIAFEVLSAIRTVTAFNAQDREVERYGRHLHEARKLGIKRGWVVGISHGTLNGVTLCTYAVAFYYGSWLIQWKFNTGGQCIGIFFALLNGLTRLGQALPYLETQLSARIATARCKEVIERKPAIPLDDGIVPTTPMRGNIEFQSITFRYPLRPEKTVFHRLSLDVHSGSYVALVGPSGGGKSSIISLLLRSYDPEEGTILIDGVPLRDLNLKWYRDQIGLVTQDPVLFSGTIRENLKLVGEHITDEQIIAACTDANVHHTIMNLPDGYDTHVGDAGVQLSGGQRQRICIARAILKNPTLLLLDEATSALDRKSEMAVQKALQRVMTNRTSVAVAHRLATIREANNIFFVSPPNRRNVASSSLDETITWSRITHQGNFGDLTSDCPEFRLMVSMQKSMDLPSSGGGRHKSLGGDETEGLAPTESAIMEMNAMHLDITSPTSNATGLKPPPATPLHLPPTQSCVTVDSSVWEQQQLTQVEPPKKAGPEVSPLKRIASMSQPEKKFVFLACLITAGAAGIYPSVAIVFAEIIGAFFKPPEEMRSEAGIWAGAFCGLGAAAFLFHLCKNGLFGVVGERLTERVRLSLLRSILHQEMSFFDQNEHSTGALCSMLSADTAKVYMLFGPTIGMHLQNLLVLAISLAVAFYSSWKLALVTVSLMPPMVIGGIMFARRKSGEKFGESGVYVKADQIAIESISGIRVVQAYNMQDALLRNYAKAIREGKRGLTFRALKGGAFQGLSFFSLYAMFALSFWWGCQLMAKNQITFKDDIRCFFAIFLAAFGLGDSAALAGQINASRLAAERVLAVLDRKTAIDPDQKGLRGNEKDGGAIQGHIELQNLQFAYPSRPKALVCRDMNLSLPSGSYTALIGVTGCGKSTVVQLLERFYDPLGGHILVDGIPLKEMELAYWRNAVGLVGQEPVLFDMTILENIRYGCPEATMEDVHLACQLANIHEFIMTLEKQYDTPVGEKGRELSGGQRQRIAIARAMVKKPAVLLLDEATAALDNVNEAEVQQALDNVIAKTHMTVVSIAHRLSSIQNAQYIAVLHEGVVVEYGTHDQLYALGGEYRARYDLYFGKSQE